MSTALAIATALGAAIGLTLIAAVQSLLADEARAWLPYASRALVRAAARRLPAGEAARYEEEWLGELAALNDRPLTGLLYSLGTWRALGALRRAGREAEERVAEESVRLAEQLAEAGAPVGYFRYGIGRLAADVCPPELITAIELYENRAPIPTKWLPSKDQALQLDP